MVETVFEMVKWENLQRFHIERYCSKGISAITTDTKDQVVQKIQSATVGSFSIHIFESNDAARRITVDVVHKVVHSGSFGETLLFSSLTTEKVSSFFESENPSWPNVCGYRTDGALTDQNFKLVIRNELCN